MYSDTHFHFHHLVDERGLNGPDILQKLVERNTFFGMDIGTRCDDLIFRYNQLEENIAQLPVELQQAAKNLIFYSAGIWPDVDEIKNRVEAMKILESKIQEYEKIQSEKNSPSHLVAIGECGLDHHWNTSGADGRCESDFDKSIFEGERELFQMQLELAQKLNLPVVIHSRDAFEDSLDCMKNVGYHNGIIHCYSYGIEEARAFLDLGWYIAFGGATTYTKKSKMEQMVQLLQYVPEDRILMETDAPYLTPVPFRGQTNTPVLVEHCYNFVAAARNVSPRDLSETVDKNIRDLFKLKLN
ncbi:MAG: TatD family hydrolase [Treponema sp.]|nr:TatD family hydrolase [Candidatus Treponema equifaecale]